MFINFLSFIYFILFILLLLLVYVIFRDATILNYLNIMVVVISNALI